MYTVLYNFDSSLFNDVRSAQFMPLSVLQSIGAAADLDVRS